MTVGELIKKLNKRDRSQTVYYIDKYGKHEITDVKPMLTNGGSITIIMNGDGGRYDRKTENSSEKPNNCEHITEDGVTCAKYPACDDCLDNPLNKVKGSERLVKGLTKINQELNQDPLHDDCFDCDKFFTCDDKGEDYKTDCPWK